MRSPWLFRSAILLALCALGIVINGAVLATTLGTGGKTLHPIVSSAVGLLALAVGLWMALGDPRPEARRLGWITVLFTIAAAGLGLAPVLAALPRLAGVSHATLGHLFFAATVAIVVVTSPAWDRGPELVQDYGWPSMRSLAITTPVLVTIQIALGAAFRQKAATLLPHVLGAMLVALVILLEAVFVLQQFPAHRALRPAAKALLGIAFGQVFLGIAALIVRSMAEDNSVVTVVTVAMHVTGGSLTLATTIVLSILIRRNVQPRPEETEEPPAS